MNRTDIIQRMLKQFPTEAPFTVVDVGCMGGIEQEWVPLRNHIRTIGFEPDRREFEKLASSAREIFFNCALHKADGIPLTIYLSRETGKSSIFKPNMARLKEFPEAARFETVGTADLPGDRVRSLDSLIRSEKLGDVHFLKLDTQGSELYILEGAEQLLRNSVTGIKVEVEFQELYEGQPLFSDVDRFLRAMGFDLIDLRRVFWRKSAHSNFSGKGPLVFGDALYLKRGPALLENLKKMTPAARLSAVLSQVTIALVYGANDTACETLMTAANIDAENHKVFMDTLQNIQKFDRCRRLPRIWGANKIFRLLARVGGGIGHQRHAFAENDLELGNRRIG